MACMKYNGVREAAGTELLASVSKHYNTTDMQKSYNLNFCVNGHVFLIWHAQKANILLDSLFISV